MNKERINILITHPEQATPEEVKMIEDVINKYPYAQLLRSLLARIHFIQDTDKKDKLLQTAAIYTTDRTVLKKLIQQKEYLLQTNEVSPYQTLVEDTISPSIHDNDTLSDDHESISIFDEVLKNLEKLKSLRQQFQFLELNETEEKKEPDEKEKKKKKKPSIAKNKTPDESLTDASIKEKKKIIEEKDLEIDTQVNAFFLQEIENKKDPVLSEPTNHNLSQNEIIEKFIVEQPTIGTIKKEIEKDHDLGNKDLAEKSTKFDDDLVSENLAVILLKQGKKNRAIDIYKKLIWKLPQKKAYFAARIEEIKK